MNNVIDCFLTHAQNIGLKDLGSLILCTKEFAALQHLEHLIIMADYQAFGASDYYEFAAFLL
jgi:hypothetical protein